VQQIDVRAARRDDEDAEREADEIEAREARILPERGRPADDAGEQCDGEADDEPARRHRPERKPRDEKADGGARQDRMAHRVAHQAHAAQHQERADGTGAKREREAGDEGAAHEAVIGEGRDDGVVEHHAARPAE